MIICYMPYVIKVWLWTGGKWQAGQLPMGSGVMIDVAGVCSEERIVEGSELVLEHGSILSKMETNIFNGMEERIHFEDGWLHFAG